ncbi:MAG TPA: hypoxanthine phosphoribosyltransferase [Candidatus Avibacteroides avistercoris]|uniref:Hypoxanthine phosphoribosyltransferase n=1 Tax=Candidatus Avibacteroides avistercoris TaxID=2840690 RepID=A0A9D2UJS6_9BACT|nr:hypoxanthine phosphoribosyltransferase [Candidatus Avibacteroides avistercoris]
MASVKIKDKVFNLSIPEETIIGQVKRVAAEINRDLADSNPIFLCVLNGAFMFAGDLMKHVNIPSEISFVKLSSYSGTESTGRVKQLIGLSDTLRGRTVVIVEDIVDTGLTMLRLLDLIREHEPKEVRICSLLVKPDKLKVDLHIDYVAMEIPNEFIVGYGLDYDGQGRNLPAIYTVE